MKNLIFSTLFFFFFVQISFGQHHHNETKKEVVVSKDLGKADSEVKKQLNNLLLAYFEVKNALVATDGNLANTKAGEFVKLLAKIEIDKMTAEQQTFYKPLAEKLKFDAEHINETQDAEHQRDHFESFSNNLFLLIKNFKANKDMIYQQFCPMAFDNKGAFWLSDKSEIRNPYFGDKMLKCGKVTEKL